ncbi:MAG: hypothetical protein K2N74_00060, partial [Clostridiales bacterium]|nr:hypothetical protein [Clostridiales bacterium]
LHAPTFRHKMYDGYKATRKPMPEDLVTQVPVLKELLREMKICIVEKEGYEADDVIGTLSRRFDGVHTHIYTGDRDSYQLVGEHVSVCFTKRGVTDLDYLTAENFYEKIELEPWQIVEEKALMGDSSDNIPGVRGIGPKSAKELLHKYGSLDAIYENLDKITGSTQTKLRESREVAYLSRDLARIDTNVPLELNLEDCVLHVPFSEEARAMFAKLEFRSLVESEFFPAERKKAVETVHCQSVADFLPLIDGVKEFALTIDNDSCHIYFNEKEYIFSLHDDLISSGVFLHELKPVLSVLLSGDRVALVADVKSLSHRLGEIGVDIKCRVEDVTLLRYLGDSNLRPMEPKALAKDFAVSEDNCAYALKLAFDGAMQKLKGSEEERLYREVELPLTFVLLDMERTGVCVDTGKFSFFSEKFNRELDESSARIFELAGVDPFNLNSTAQLSEVLFDKLGYDAKGVKKNSNGKHSTNAEVLEKLAEEHEIARLILRYREIQKLKSTYVDGIRPLVIGGVIHTTYNQTTTTTGRLSSVNPNLQNIPVRKED